MSGKQSDDKIGDRRMNKLLAMVTNKDVSDKKRTHKQIIIIAGVSIIVATIIGIIIWLSTSPVPEPSTTTTSPPHIVTQRPIIGDGPPSLKTALATEAYLTSSPLFKEVKRSIATLESEEVEKIDISRSDNPTNVKLVERLFSEEDWNFLFPIRDAAYTYRRFLQAVGKFPAVCGDYKDATGRDPQLICRRTLATMFAHFTQETGGHEPYGQRQVPEWRQGLVYLRESGCSDTGPGCGYDNTCGSSWQGQAWPCGKTGGGWSKYFGRGAKQLSYNYNYGPFSDAMFGNVTKLLENPDLVASTWLNLASAIWFYTYPQPPKPSMLHVIDGTWQPNDEDLKQHLQSGFGATIMIINGGIECGHTNPIPQAKNRQEYYRRFSEYFKVDIIGEELGCSHMSSFKKGGAGSMEIYWDREWSRKYECKLVKYQTPENALQPGDYVKCVERLFKIKLI